MDTKSWYQSKTIWGAIVAFLSQILKPFGVEISDTDSAELVNVIFNIVAGIGTVVAIYGRIRAAKPIAPKKDDGMPPLGTPLMKLLIISALFASAIGRWALDVGRSAFSFFLICLLSVSLSLLSGCASWYAPAKTEAGAAIVAKVSDSVIDKGLKAAADKIDDYAGPGPDNPYLHAVADALRANSGSLVSPADVQRIAINYGDPNNKAKFKTLAADLWTLLKNATAQFGKVAGTELIAQGLNGTPPEKAAEIALAVGK